MANTLLHADVITKESLRVLHEKLQFIGTINRQYDSSFSVGGAKVGDTIRIRKPARLSTRSGTTMGNDSSGSAGTIQNFVEEQIPLTVNRQIGVDLSFTDKDLTLSLDDFSKRIIEPAMSILASTMESDVLENLTNSLGRYIQNNTGITWKNTVQAKAILDQQTTPQDNNRCLLIDPMMQVDVLDETKGLFQSSNAISKQYLEGEIGRTGGFKWVASSRIPIYQTGESAAATQKVVLANGASSVTMLGTVDGKKIVKGTIFTIAGVMAVHPETKKTLTTPYAFVVAETTELSTTVGAAVPVYALDNAPGAGIAAGSGVIVGEKIYISGPMQNVSSAGSDASAITQLGAVNKSGAQSLAYHKDAFTFATADLVLPKGVDMASRQVYEGISLRMVRDWNQTDGTFPVRFDLLYGFQTLRPEYAIKLIDTLSA